MNTSCGECGSELYQANPGGTWADTEYDSPECIDENGNAIQGQPHVPDLCSDGTPEHNWIGPEFGEQICPECGSTQIVAKAQTGAQAGIVPGGPNTGPNPYAPSNPAIIERFKVLQEKREKEMEDRKKRTYRESLGDDFFPDMRFQGGEDPDPGQCQLCPISFDDDKELLRYHMEQVHGVGVSAGTDDDEDDDDDA
jgi:hypothetical protein